MKLITQNAFQRTRNFIMTHGREVDQRLFSFHFESGGRPADLDAKNEVLAALVKFQNNDGGFGHALEPDLRTPASSAIATSTGFHILRQIDAPAADPVVKKAIQYLVDTYDGQKGVWPIIPPAADSSPHAFWWDYQSSETNFDDFVVNPKAAIVGHLHHFAQLVPEAFLAEVTGSVVAYLETMPDDQMNMHDFQCYLELATAANLPADLKDRVSNKLFMVLPGTMERDPAKWPQYGYQPLDAAPFPGALLAPAVNEQDINTNLDYLIDNQLADGTWGLGWSWAEAYPDAWKQAELDWKGYNAVTKLRTLRAFGRIEGF